MSPQQDREQPLYAWIITINREPTDAEFALCLRCLDDESYHKICAISDREEAWRSLLGRLIPSIVMKQRNVPRNAWTIKTTKAGKPYIDAPQEEKHLGYNIAHDGSIVTMAFSLGRKHKVWNIGVDAVRITLPKNIPFSTYVDSLSHKLTPTERAYLDVNDAGASPSDNERRALNRLFIIWTVKESYIKALGQPAGFDFTRIDCRIPESQIFVDGKKLNGWEFRLFKANVGVFRSPNSLFKECKKDGLGGMMSAEPELQSEVYQCCMTIYRGGDQDGCVFKWGDQASELDKYLRFVTLDAMVNAAKHLSADGLGREREIVRAPGYDKFDKPSKRDQQILAAHQKDTSLGRAHSYRESGSVGA